MTLFISALTDIARITKPLSPKKLNPYFDFQLIINFNLRSLI